MTTLPPYLVELKITKLDQNQQKIITTVKGKNIEDVKRKVTGILDLMEEGDL